MNWFQWNMRYIRTVNSCDNGKLQVLYGDIGKLPNAFTRKRYVWNLIRGKTFWINAGAYVVENVNLAKLSIDITPGHVIDKETNQLLEQTSTFIHNLMLSEKDEEVKKSFVWYIIKRVPFLTVDLLPYIHADRVRKLLHGDWVINDNALEGLITEILELRLANDSLTEMISQINN